MTTIHASTAGASARYYTRYLAEDGPEEDGHWVGSHATGLGLTGAVSTDDLEAVLSGLDPQSGTTLGRPLVDRFDAKGRLLPAVAAFDATFSAPKSVSVWWALTGDPGLLDAHDRAVNAVLDHLERYGATTRVRSNGHRQHLDAAGLTMAAFRQLTSREDDPQIHTHVVVSAKVQGPDGRWLALDARYLKRHQRALGGLYQSVLRAELTDRFGIRWGEITNGQAEIDGIAPELLTAFSKRTSQVDRRLAAEVVAFTEREGRDPSRWERAALTRKAAQDTRPTKTGTALHDLRATWTDEADALGWTPTRLLDATVTAAQVVPAPRAVTVADVVEQLSATGSTWTRADVLRVVCDLMPPASQTSGHPWAQLIEAACDRVIGECENLDPPGPGPVRASDGRSIWLAPTESHLTHAIVLAQEERIVLFAIDAHDPAPAPSTTVALDGLDVMQADAAAAVAGRDRLVVVVGPAGTGKTTTLRRAAQDLRDHDRPVFAIAPTAKAAKVLRDETGIAADTLAKLLHEWRTGRPEDDYRLHAGTTVVLDEAGMVGTGNLDELIALAESQDWRLVLVGDPRQLQAVGRGGMFNELCRLGRTHPLATIHRFHHDWERTASLELRSGNPDALDTYREHGRIHPGAFDDLATEAAHRWITHTAAGRTVAVVAETNEHVDALNHTIRDQRRALGHLGRQQVRIGGGEIAAVGDIVVTRQNDRTLCTDHGEPVRNRERWTVTAVQADGALRLSHLHGQGEVNVPADYARTQVRLGYAATAHGHQGDTVDYSITMVTPATSHRSLYVGVTRGRNQNDLFVVADDDTHALETLGRVLTHDSVDTPAIAQRRELTKQIRSHTSNLEGAETALAAARDALQDSAHRSGPALEHLRQARTGLTDAQRELQQAHDSRNSSLPWKRHRATNRVTAGDNAVLMAQKRLDTAQHDAAPVLADLDLATADVERAEHAVAVARLTSRLDALARTPSTHELAHSRGIEPPGL